MYTFDYLDKIKSGSLERHEHIKKIGLDNTLIEIPNDPSNRMLRIEYPETTKLIATLAGVGTCEVDYVNGRVSALFNNSNKITKELQKIVKPIETLWSDWYNMPWWEQIKRAAREMSAENTQAFISQVADISKTRKLFISGRIEDFVNASENCSYTSCYSHDGEYFLGTVANYMAGDTLLAWTEKHDKPGYKIGRAWIFFDKNKNNIAVGRAYGSLFNQERRNILEWINKTIGLNVSINKESGKNVDTSRIGYHDEKREFYYLNESFPMETERMRSVICPLCGSITTENSLSECCEDRYSCDNCGERLSDHECYSNEHDEGTYCHHCYEQLYSTCDFCDREIRKSNETHVYYNGRIYCENCAKDMLATCEKCEEYIVIDEVGYAATEGGIILCENCYNVCDCDAIIEKPETECEACKQARREDESECTQSTKSSTYSTQNCEHRDLVGNIPTINLPITDPCLLLSHTSIQSALQWVR